MRRIAFVIGLSLIGCFLGAWIVNDSLDSESLTMPLGLPAIEWPADNAYSAAKAELGRLLFSDVRLSSDNSIACASCHSIPKALTDHIPLAMGIHGREGKRHTPTLINAAFNTAQFWDGRAQSLEEQALGPIGNSNEMTLETTREEAYRTCEQKIRSIEEYRPLFKEAFGHEECTLQDIAQAIATFERTLVSGNSAFDRYQAGDLQALTPEQRRGWEIFKQANCSSCHRGANFTNSRFANIGIGMDQLNPDLGRYEVTNKPQDWGAFKVPTLREVSLTGPYMHDGSLQTLEDVIDYYNRGGIPNPNLNPLIRPLHLSEKDKKDLLQFLESLQGEGWQQTMPFPPLSAYP